MIKIYFSCLKFHVKCYLSVFSGKWNNEHLHLQEERAGWTVSPCYQYLTEGRAVKEPLCPSIEKPVITCSSLI